MGVRVRFLGVDPMAEKYPMHSGYMYCAGNPIKYIDPDGQEWDVTETSSRKTISVDVKFSNSTNLSKEQIVAYQEAISSQFNETMHSSSNGEYSGRVTYGGGQNDNQFTPSLQLYEGGDNNIGGMEYTGSANVNIRDKIGNLRSPADVAKDAVHELLHTVRLDHPFENTQSLDTELIHISGNNYRSTPKTDSNILYNIMNYSSTNIDGRLADRKQTLLTRGQINMMVKEITMQKQGYGMRQYDPNISETANQQRALRMYFDYWENKPGQSVIRNR
jgi:hypothetical protein